MDRYDDADLNAMKDILVGIVVLTRHGKLKDFLRGKQLFLQEEIDRELRLRESEKRAAEEAAKAASEPEGDDPPQKNENPPT